MFTVGEFARLGSVSVRTLHHYDAIGLLRPAAVDAATGYRRYAAAQLARLNRIVALKDLGFPLPQVDAILGDALGPDELRGMLRLRRAELRERLDADTGRLARVEARLRTIEQEHGAAGEPVVVRALAAVRVAELVAPAAAFEPAAIGPVVGPLFTELLRRTRAAGVAATGPGIARYETVEGGEHLLVHACLPVDADRVGGPGSDGPAVVELPAVAAAATVLHRGPMAEIVPSLQRLGRWIEEHGYAGAGDARELYLHHDGPQDDWEVELQAPVTRTDVREGDPR